MSPTNASPGVRVLVFGASGHLGQELIALLGKAPFAISTLEGVVSEGSEATEFEFRGELWDAHEKWPDLRKGDLVFVCTPKAIAADVIRAALRAEAPCIDCSGTLSDQPGVLVPARRFDEATGPGAAQEEKKRASTSPVSSLPSSSLLAWTPLLDRLAAGPGLVRVVGTVLCAASAQGREGLVALSEESIGLFNQEDRETVGPAGQPVAFDIVPGALEEERILSDAERVLGDSVRIDISSLQVPAFVGEGVSLSLELARAIDEAELRTLFEEVPGLRVAEEGLGSRGLVAVESTPLRVPSAPTLRDAVGTGDVIAGRLRADRSLPEGLGWRIWLAYDPARLMAEQAIRVAAQRLAGS